MRAYYNENDPGAAAWLRELISEGLIAPGDVDERSIVDVKPNDLKGYGQCHFFAGIGGWSRALRLAGVPDDRPVWTGSCPCQPFSSAGKGLGFDDERNLWWSWFHLISQCRPSEIYGEQVASKDGLLWWFDLVQTDLQAAGYLTVAQDRCGAGVGAPHIRQRLYFAGILADSYGARSQGRGALRERTDQCAVGSGGVDGILAVADGDGCSQGQGRGSVQTERDAEYGECFGIVGNTDSQDVRGGSAESHRPKGGAGYRVQGDTTRTSGSVFEGLEHAPSLGRIERWSEPEGRRAMPGCSPVYPSTHNNFWSDCDWLWCLDGKWRPVEPGTFPLAHGIPERVGLLRGYGNAIIPQVAAGFIEDVMSC